MSSERDIERLVRQVTDLVLARMNTTSTQQESARRLVRVLLPMPTENIKALASLLASLEKDGYPTSTLVTADVKTWLESVGMMASFPGDVQYIHGPWDELHYPIEPRSHVLLLGSLGFSFCKRLLGLDDEDPMVLLVTRALLKRVRVVAIRDDLQPTEGNTGSLAQNALSVLRDLERMDLDVLGMQQAGEHIRNICASDATVSKAFSALLGEVDVQKLWASGHRKIVLAQGAVVTPLARNKAAELGIELVESGR